MTALANNNPRKFVEKTKVVNYPLTASVKVYDGSFLTVTTGKALSLTAGDTFLGIACEFKDNTGNMHTHIGVVAEGIISGVTITGSSTTSSVGAAVAVSDNNTLTLTSTGNSLINGKVVAYDSVSATYTVSFKSSVI